MSEVIIPESVKQEFDNWYAANNYCWATNNFDELPFDFQSGVYHSYLRSVEIHIRLIEDYAVFDETVYLGRVKSYNDNKFINSEWYSNYNEAEISAINEGFKLREQQLINAK